MGKAKSGTKGRLRSKRREQQKWKSIMHASIIKVSLLLLSAALQEINAGAQCVCATVIDFLFHLFSLSLLLILACIHRYKCIKVCNIQDLFKYFLYHDQFLNGSTVLSLVCILIACVLICVYLAEVSKTCMFTGDHIKEDRNSGPSQLFLWDQSHLQDGTHHAGDETDFMTA